MIKPEGLRIGDLINFDGVQIEIDICDLKSLSNNNTELYNEKYKPIPLTQEWHNKLGVEIDGFNSYVYELPRVLNVKIEVVFNGDYVYLRQRNDEYRHNDSLVSIWNKDLTKRDMYIHEWQNLYRSLTGLELTIKE